MKPPKIINGVQKLNMRITALGRFISRSAERCLPFFKILKGAEKFAWDEEYDRSFEKLKEYLGKPPLLCIPMDGDDLCVYLGASDRNVAAVLIKEEGSVQRPVYYVSKELSDVETRYFNAEKVSYVSPFHHGAHGCFFEKNSSAVRIFGEIVNLVHRAYRVRYQV